MNANRFLQPDSASARLYAEARRVIPGGTSKANLVLKAHPFYVVSGRGCRVADVDDAERLDANNNFTALIHGHAFAPVAVPHMIQRQRVPSQTKYARCLNSS